MDSQYVCRLQKLNRPIRTLIVQQFVYSLPRLPKDIPGLVSSVYLKQACQRNMSGIVRLIVASSSSWRHETWLVSPGRNLTGFRPRNLGRFFDDPIDDDLVPMILWNRLPLYRLLMDALSMPPSLSTCCMILIRTTLTVAGRTKDGRQLSLFERIERLTLPTALKELLRLEEGRLDQ